MPSEARMERAAEALRTPLLRFRSALAEADEEARAHVTRRSAAGDPGAALAAELGVFAEGRIDAGRLALLTAGKAGDSARLDLLMEEARVRFAESLEETEPGIRIDLVAGADLRDEVRDALARLGRVFGVSHRVRLARSGLPEASGERISVAYHPFRRWTQQEREIAPPLLLSVAGSDLRCAGLAEFLVGGVKLVLVVEGPTPPAPLARLIGHGIFVAQGTGPELLDRLAVHPGPGVVAWTEEGSGAVAFVHDPATGDRPWSRLSLGAEVEALEARITEASRRGRASAEMADLRHLLELANPPGEAGGTPLANGGAPGPTAEDPADRLAAWLLARTDLKGL